jgi:hypothetical protein
MVLPIGSGNLGGELKRRAALEEALDHQHYEHGGSSLVVLVVK